MRKQRNATFDMRGFTLLFVAGMWLAGIVLETVLVVPALALLVGAAASLLSLPLFWSHAQNRLVMLLLACLFLGAFRFALASPENDPNNIALYTGKTVYIEGNVSSEPQIQGRSRELVVTVSQLRFSEDSPWKTADGQLKLQTSGTLEDDPYGANYGDDVELHGKVQPPQLPSTPGVVASMAFPGIYVDQNVGNPLLAFFYSLRTMLATLIEQSLPQPAAALLIAIFLSMRTPALKPLLVPFNATGLAHLVAPSGFKVTILAGLVANSSKRLYEKQIDTFKLLPAQKRGNWRHLCATLLVAATILMYTLLSGAGPAALRAGIMGCLLVIAPRLGRTYNVYTALALSALFMTLFDPFVLWDVGFLLSFLGTLGIVLLTPYVQHRLRLLEVLPFGTHIAELIAVTLAATIATAPLMATVFNTISFIAPIANVLVVPLLAILLILGLLISVTGMLYLPLAILVGYVAWPLLTYVSTVVLWCYQLPYSYLHVDSLDNRIAWVYYALLACAVYYLLKNKPHDAFKPKHKPVFSWSKRTQVIVQVSVALLIVSATVTSAFASRFDNRLSVTFLSVGPTGEPPQGEAILVQTPDAKTILIDGGLDSTSLAQQLDSHLPSWQRTLDAVVLTSPRADQLTGLQDIVTRFEVGEVIDAGMLHPSATYALWRSTLRSRDISYIRAMQGMTIRIGTQVALQILWPLAQLHKGTTEVVDNGLALRLLSRNFSLLLLGSLAQSSYALAGLLQSLSPNYLTASIVQIIGETDKALPNVLIELLQQTRCSLLVITPGGLSTKLRKSGSTVMSSSQLATVQRVPHLRILQTAQVGTYEISGASDGWSTNSTSSKGSKGST